MTTVPGTPTSDDLSPRRPIAPRIPADLVPTAMGETDVLQDADWDGVRISGWLGPGVEGSAVTFATARFEAVDLSSAQFAHLTLRDCDIVGSNLANLTARESTMVRVAVRHSRLTGLAWPGGKLLDVRFEDCRADLASFRFATLSRVTFSHCVLVELDFQGVRGDSITFLDCDLGRAQFSAAQFHRSEIRRCNLERISGISGLRGMGLMPADIVGLASALAGDLGIRTLQD